MICQKDYNKFMVIFYFSTFKTMRALLNSSLFKLHYTTFTHSFILEQVASWFFIVTYFSRNFCTHATEFWAKIFFDVIIIHIMFFFFVVVACALRLCNFSANKLLGIIIVRITWVSIRVTRVTIAFIIVVSKQR